MVHISIFINSLSDKLSKLIKKKKSTMNVSFNKFIVIETWKNMLIWVTVVNNLNNLIELLIFLYSEYMP